MGSSNRVKDRVKKQRNQVSANSAYNAMQRVLSGENWKIAYMDFVDDFRRDPQFQLIQKKPSMEDFKLYALLHGICFQLCLDSKINLADWLAEPVFLKQPWFVSGMKSLRAMALRDSPMGLKRNNIFVLDNFLMRV